VALAVGIVFVAPSLHMPALTVFTNGQGPVWKGSLFPFLFITIACGSVSGFHALIASGTTPKLIASEVDARFIGYGSMLMESFVAIMALTSACILEPGIYFTMNSPAAIVGTTPESASEAVTKMGFPVTPELISERATEVGEQTIISRAGGAPTLAVGMAEIFSGVLGGKGLKAFWYHFAILFEALFILTAVDAGTRAGRFMLQDLLGTAIPSFKSTSSLVPSLVATFLCVTAWGCMLYQGVTDPLGGVNTLWPLFGMSNQMLAAIALILATVVIFKMKRQQFAWVTIVPATWLIICTMWAGFEKVFSSDAAVGFIAHASKFKTAADAGTVLTPAKSMEQMQQIIANDRVDAALSFLFTLIVISLVVFGVRACVKAYGVNHWTAKETPSVPDNGVSGVV
ncbi:MAG: carbon starvation protein A, partial [Clostridia bacterium]|nr:carbon starvation protein A [Deltaproteobacteria bacterium]